MLWIAKKAAVQIGLKQVLRITLMFEGEELADALRPQCLYHRRSVQDAVFGEVEAASGLEDETIHLGGQTEKTPLLGRSHREVERQGVAIYGMSHQEIIGAVSLEDPQIWDNAVSLREFYLRGEDGLGVFVGNEALVLNEAARLIGMFPVRHVVQ